MSDALSALASENLNLSLRSVLEDVQKGYIRIPRFQRPFVWSDDQRLELLRSIRDNMPIGSLLVWRTAKFELASFRNVGPHRVGVGPAETPATGWQYMLDGHQRVSTLLGVLLKPPPLLMEDLSIDDPDIDWNIQYDLRTQDFVFADRRRYLTSQLLPLHTLLDGRLVNKHMRSVRQATGALELPEDEMDELEDRANQIAYRFQQFRVPIVVMASESLELAAKTFQRVNSLGTPMSEAHMVAALTWQRGFDLRERIDEYRDGLPHGWKTLDDAIFLQVCKGLTDLDVTRTGQTELVNYLRERPELLTEAAGALNTIIGWMGEDLGVVSEEVLPYALQLSLLAIDFGRRGEKGVPKERYREWFWRTGWSGVFSSAAYRDVVEEQRILRAGDPASTWIRDQGLPERFDFRSARVRLFLARMARRRSTVDGARNLLISHGRDALVKLFPSARISNPQERSLAQGAGNKFLIPPNRETSFRQQLESGSILSGDSAYLHSHFLDAKGIELISQGEIAAFLERRAEAMEAWDFMEWCSERDAATL